MPRPTPSSRSTPAAAVAGAILITAYAVLGTLQILVLNPMAVRPGLSLFEIHREMAAQNEELDPVFPLIFAGVGVLLAVAVVAVAFAWSGATTEIVLVAVGVILMLGAPAYWIASFGPGMSLADAFYTSGGDHAPWAIPLYAVSIAGFVCVITLLVRQVMRAAQHSGRPQR
ncbi:MAG: hypothetical protein ACTJHU_03840 [Mycetocola sp.]